MTNKELKNHLYDLLVPRKGDLEGVCYDNKYLHAAEGSDMRNIYEACSETMCNSGLTFDFSYKVLEKAVNILSECRYIPDVAEGNEEIQEAVDAAVPCYTNELMSIYSNNYDVVDSYDDGGGNSVQRAQSGWYSIIDQVTQSLAVELSELIDND